MTVRAKKTILLCLATQKGLAVLKAARGFREQYEFLVCTFEEKLVAESYGNKIRELAEEHGFSIVPLKEFRENLLGLVNSHDVSSMICIGWRYLVPSEVVGVLNHQVIVAHDSLLPKLRGFAPLPTAIITGEEETGVTYLRAGSGVDDGHILWQGRVRIAKHETIGSLTEKVLPLYTQGARLYLQGELSRTMVQDESQATYSIWRDECDYRIDWSQDAATIERSIRALGLPYLGAQTSLGVQRLTIHRATIVPDLRFAIRQAGKVWSVDESGRPTIVCGIGMLRIEEASCDGESVIPLKSLRVRLT